MVDISNCNFTSITDKTVKLEEYFIKLYVNKFLESESAISSTQRIHRILDAKYETDDLNTVISKQCQHLNDE